MASAFVVERVNPSALRGLNYRPEVERLKRNSQDAVRLGSLLQEIGPAYGAVFVRRDCEPVHGIELVSQADMFAAEPSGRVIRRDSMSRPDRHEIKKWQILIAGAGTLGETELFGRALIADDRLVGKYVGPHAMVLTFQEPHSDRSLYAYAFLCTSIGVLALRSTSYGTKVLGLRKDLLRDIPIPAASAATEARVAALVREAVENRARYASGLASIRLLLDRVFGLDSQKEVLSKRVARATAAEPPFATLCAWNFASLGPALRELRRNWRLRLRDMLEVDGIFKGGRFARRPCTAPHGVDLFSQRDVFSIRPIARRIVRPNADDRTLFVTDDMLLVASRGQLTEGSLFGHIERGGFSSGRMITEDITRLVPRGGSSELVYAVLSTRLGHALLRSTAFGTSIPGMRIDLLEDLPFPEIDERTAEAITQHVRAASAARLTAADAEESAIRLVEKEVLSRWLA